MKYDENGKAMEFDEFPTLETNRLILREITPNDAEFWLQNFSDPEVVEMTAYEAPTSIEMAMEEIREYCTDIFANNTGIRWGIELKSLGELIGTAGYHDWVKTRGYSSRMGYDLLREYRRRGIMKEALRPIIDYGFMEMCLNRIQVLIDPKNVASVNLIESLGFKREGVLRGDTYFRGRFYDDLSYSLLSEEWSGKQENVANPIAFGSESPIHYNKLL